MSRTCRRTCEDVEHLLPPPQWEPAWGLLLWDRMRRRSVRGARFRGVRLCVHDRSRHRDQVKLDAMHLRSGLARTFQAMQLRLRNETKQPGGARRTGITDGVSADQLGGG